MTERKRSFYGWGYEDYQLPVDELAWFERAWSGLFKVNRFEPAVMPRADEITLRAPRVVVPTSLAAVCTTDKHERLFHSFGRSVHDLARMIHRRDFSNPPDVVAYPKRNRILPAYSIGAARMTSPRFPSAAARAWWAA